MGSPGQFLFEDGFIMPSLEERVEFVRKTCEENNYYTASSADYTSDKEEVELVQWDFSDIPFSENGKRVTSVYIVNYCGKKARYWYVTPFYPTSKKDYFRIFFFPDYSDQQDLILTMVYKLMQQYPQAVYWTGYDWLFTKEDIDNIWQQPFDEEWPFKPPKNE